MIWIRWRWQYSFSFGPYTRYHAVDPNNNRRTMCVRDAKHFAQPPWGNTTDDPPAHQRCKQCVRRIDKDVTP